MGKGGMTATAVYKSVADEKSLKTKDVKAIVAAYMGIASTEVKKQGSFKVAGMLKMKLKVKGDESAKRHQSLHQGALCLQGQACLEDCEVLRHEEAQGCAELRGCMHKNRLWAVQKALQCC